MLSLKLADTVVDLGDEKLSLVLTSPYPLMHNDSNTGNYIFNFKIPATPALRHQLQFPDKPQSLKKHYQLPFELTAAGFRFTGQASIKQAGDDMYEVFCPVGNGNFNVAAKNTKLNEIDLGDDYTFTSALLIHAQTTSDMFYDMFDPDFGFVESDPIEFDDILINSGELNASGTIFTASEAMTVNLHFNITSYFTEGFPHVRIFKNGTPVETISISRFGNSVFSYQIELANNDQVSWHLYIESEDHPEWQGEQAGDYIQGTMSHATLMILPASMSSEIAQASINRYPDSDFAVFPLENPVVFEKWPDDLYEIDNLSVKELYNEYFKIVNYWQDGSFAYLLSTVSEGEHLSAANMFVPFPYIAYLVKRIALHFQFRILDNPFEDELKYAVLINHFIQNSFIGFNAKLFSASNSFNLQDHVPDWSIHHFLQQLCNLFGLGYEVNNELQTIEFSFLEDIMLDQEAIDITDMVIEKPTIDFQTQMKSYSLEFTMPDNDEYFKEVEDKTGLNYIGEFNLLGDLPATANINDLCYLHFLRKYMVWGYDNDNYQFGWLVYGPHYVDRAEEKSEFADDEDDKGGSVQTELIPLMNVHKADALSSGRVWSIPASYQPAQFKGAPETFQSEWSPLIAWYHGLRNDSQGNPYPFASAGTTDYNGNAIPGADLALTLDGENGLLAKKWQRYLNWRLMAKPAKVRIVPSLEFLRTFKFRKKVRINGVTYLITQARGNVDRSGPGVWQLSLLVF